MRILLVGHDASLTGAPKLLLGLQKFITEQPGYEVTVFLAGDGPLLSQFERTSRVFKYVASKLIIGNKLVALIARNIIRNRIRKFKPDCILFNTIAVGPWAEYLATIPALKIAWIHELEFVMQQMNRKSIVERLIANCKVFVVPSKAVLQNLYLNHGIDKACMHLVYEGIDLMKNQEPKNASLPNNELEYNSKDIVIGGCGSLIWRKGYDLFIQVAKDLQTRVQGSNIHFLWVGGNTSSSVWLEVHHEVLKLGLKNIRFTGEVENPEVYFNRMDVFLMTSREDPFPLVNLEAANAGLPIICFADTGGSEEFVTPDVGFVVPYGDWSSMAIKVVELISDSALREKMGKASRNKVANYSEETMGKQILALINSSFESN